MASGEGERPSDARHDLAEIPERLPCEARGRCGDNARKASDDGCNARPGGGCPGGGCDDGGCDDESARYQPVHHERGDDVSTAFPLPSLSAIEGVEPSHSGATREVNTMPQWAGSCWYYLRYIDNKNADRFVGAEAERYWMGGINPQSKGGVDLYVGGTEHAVLHLLYARFWHKVLFDLGHVSTPEPFQRLVNQGLILGEDGQK